MPIDQWVSISAIVLAAISILGATGSVSVLYYRVRALEVWVREAKLARIEDRNAHAEDREILIALKRDVEWLRNELQK